MFYTNVFYNFYFILFYLHNEFTNIKCSLLSRVKNPVEHILTTTTPASYELPKNIYRYEPYRGHRTLWRPTSPDRASLKQQIPLASRTRSRVIKQQYGQQVRGQQKESSTQQSYWYHFDDDEGAWPKVLLLLSSTERTTSPRKKVKKTLASYFPDLKNKYTTSENTNFEDQNDNEEGDAVAETSKTNDFGTNWISLNSGKVDYNIVLLRNEDDMETEEAEAEDDKEIKRRTYVNTTTTKNSSNIERKNEGKKTEAELKKENEQKSKAEQKNVVELKNEIVNFDLALNKGRELKKKEEMKTEEMLITNAKLTTNAELIPKAVLTTNAVLTTKALLRTTKDNLQNNSNAPRCYQCGLNVPEIPSVPTCYNIFSGDERKYVFMKRRYKVTCKNSYKDGCFRRFLDIGGIYDEMGCRTMPPMLGKSFASTRLAVLEKSMYSLTEGCISSPHASLTPFSRGISLFARYQACVCVGRYCNHGNALHANSLSFVLILFLTMLALASNQIGCS